MDKLASLWHRAISTKTGNASHGRRRLIPAAHKGDRGRIGIRVDMHCRRREHFGRLLRTSNASDRPRPSEYSAAQDTYRRGCATAAMPVRQFAANLRLIERSVRFDSLIGSLWTRVQLTAALRACIDPFKVRMPCCCKVISELASNPAGLKTSQTQDRAPKVSAARNREGAFRQ